MYYIRACFTGGHVLQEDMYLRKTRFKEEYILLVGVSYRTCITGGHVLLED